MMLMGVVVGVLAGGAFGHGLELFATGDGTRITGKVTYDDHAPADHVTITVANEAGEVLTTVETDHDGGFQLQALGAFDHYLSTETIDGHAADHRVPASELGGADGQPESGAAAVGGKELESIVARQVQPLREQLADFERGVGLRDILGGIGYIVGVLGIIAYVKARRQPPVA
jgi:nickel transport protein